MEITTKKIINLAVAGIIGAGLASCSSSPAPWTQSDDSPWQSKRDTETQALPSDDAVTESTYSDPVLLADPEPEPIIIAEPEPAPAPEMITPVVVAEAMTPEQEIMDMPVIFGGNVAGTFGEFGWLSVAPDAAAADAANEAAPSWRIPT